MVVILLAVAASLIWKALPRDSATRVTVGQALRDFRGEAGGRGGEAGGRGFPRPGVYRYATQGGETLDTAVSSAGHDYGGISTITIEASGCGVEERWQALAERWTQARLCLGPAGSRLDSLRDHHQFFGIAQVSDYRCEGSALPPASDLRAGEGWATECNAENSAVSSLTRVLGAAVLTIAGEPVAAIRTRSRSALSGESSGTAMREEWWRRSDGLLLRREVEVEADLNVLGGGHYSESISLRIRSLEPLR